MKTKAVLVGVLLAGVILAGWWLWASPTRRLPGTWESPAYYLTFTGPAEGKVYVRSRDCTGWPSHQMGDATLAVELASGALGFPTRDERQPYYLGLVGGELEIDGAGPLPAGSYTYANDSTFAPIGICGLTL
jgi:hypothetical protein